MDMGIFITPWWITFVLFFSQVIPFEAKLTTEEKPLNIFISHYEPLSYDRNALRTNHHRTKRSADLELKLDFYAHGRDFKLRLHRDASPFSQDIVIENSHGTIKFDTERVYKGKLLDEYDSEVHGLLTSEGIFEGEIRTVNETYVMEDWHHYFSEPPEGFHSVIYRNSDVKMDQFGDSLCKSDEIHRKLRQWQTAHRMKMIKNAERKIAATNKPVAEESHHIPFNSGNHASSPHTQTQHTYNRDQIHTDTDSIQGASSHSMYFSNDFMNIQDRVKRRRRQIDHAKTTCTLYLQADHLFYEKFGHDEEVVIDQLTQHILGVNDIYSIIDFDEDGFPDNINFIIKRIKVHTDSSAPGYRFPGEYGVETFLELFSEDNFDAFCLAYMFTYRDFEGGTLGLAWTGDLQNAGGVCEKNGQFRGSLKSLNSGIVTILNYGKDVPSTVSHVTMAHEIGHNMGSQHDPETADCSPGGDPGNFIMFARATSGDKANNNKFSTCSKASMALVMEDKARNSDGCFIAATSSICGNEVVEEGEECDCGWEDECQDRCCNPQVSGDPGQRKPCTRRVGAFCSPSEGPCCSQYCNFIEYHHNKTCREATSCKEHSVCNGDSPYCPDARLKPDKTKCDDDAVCYHGECTGSICLAYELETCQCEAESNKFTDGALCQLCCKEPGSEKQCRPSYEWNLPQELMAKAGMPCNDYKGYCDKQHRCVEVHRKAFLFSEEGMASLREWMKSYWYILITGAGGFTIIMGLFIKVCAPRRTSPRLIMTKQLPPSSSIQPVHHHYVQQATSAQSFQPITAKKLAYSPVPSPVPSYPPASSLGGGPYQPQCKRFFQEPETPPPSPPAASSPSLTHAAKVCLSKVPQTVNRTNFQAHFGFKLRGHEGWV